MKPSSRAHAALIICGAILLPCPLTVQAQTQPRPSAAPSPTLPAQQPRTYMPKAGESLDRIIANTMAGSPLRIELLRQAYVELNPGAFRKGKVPQLRQNVLLTVPNHEQLLKNFLPPLPSGDAAQHPTFRSSSEDRWRWVQYP